MGSVNKIVAVTVAAVLVIGAAWYGVGRYQSPPSVPTDAGASEQSGGQPVAKGGRATSVNSIESIPWARAESHVSGSWFADLRSRADAGDVVAQRDLAEIYQRCSVFSLSPANMYSTLDAYARIRGAPEGAYDDIKKRFAAAASIVVKSYRKRPTGTGLNVLPLRATRTPGLRLLPATGVNSNLGTISLSLGTWSIQPIRKQFLHSVTCWLSLRKPLSLRSSSPV